MLTFNLKKEWFDKIKSGEKTHEYRIVKDYWTERLVKEFFGIDKKKRPHDFIYYKKGMILYLETEKGFYNHPTLCFMNGMFSEEKRPRLYSKMKSVRIVDGLNTDLKFNGQVYDFEFELIKEEENEQPTD